MFFAKSTNSFYDARINLAMPSDAKSITLAQWQACMDAQALQGMEVGADANGLPIPVAAAPMAVKGITIAQQGVAMMKAMRRALNAQAIAWGFESMVDAASYATSGVSLLADEAKALITWRDGAQMAAKTLLAGVSAGTTPVPANIPAFLAAVLPPVPVQPTA